MELLSPRLRYIRFNETHLNDYFSLENDPEVMKYYQRGASKTIADSLPFFQRYMDYMSRQPQLGGFVVYDRMSGEFVGIAVIMHLELKEENAGVEIGYRLHKKFWGQGLATEMANCMLDFGFGTLGFAELFGTINPLNVASQKVLEKVGMKEVGTGAYHGGSLVFKKEKGQLP